MSEQWKLVEGSCGYMVSDLGRVKSLARMVRSNTGVRAVQERILATYVCKSTGYRQCVIHKKKVNVHRLVAVAFLAAPTQEKWQVNHKNGVRSDPALSNLEWCSPSENVQHGFNSNGRKSPTFGCVGKGNATSKPVIATHIESGVVRRYESGNLAVQDGFMTSGISRACRGLISSHGGYRWQFAHP